MSTLTLGSQSANANDQWPVGKDRGLFHSTRPSDILKFLVSTLLPGKEVNTYVLLSCLFLGSEHANILCIQHGFSMFFRAIWQMFWTLYSDSRQSDLQLLLHKCFSWFCYVLLLVCRIWGISGPATHWQKWLNARTHAHTHTDTHLNGLDDANTVAATIHFAALQWLVVAYHCFSLSKWAFCFNLETVWHYGSVQSDGEYKIY